MLLLCLFLSAIACSILDLSALEHKGDRSKRIRLDKAKKFSQPKEGDSLEDQLRREGALSSKHQTTQLDYLKEQEFMPELDKLKLVKPKVLAISSMSVILSLIDPITGNEVIRKDILSMDKYESEMHWKLGKKTSFVPKLYGIQASNPEHSFFLSEAVPDSWNNPVNAMDVDFGILQTQSIYMEYMPGGDLLNKSGAKDELLRLWLAEAYACIDRLHVLGYIHLDVKQENFFIGSDEHLRIGDFAFMRHKSSKDTTPIGGTSFFMPKNKDEAVDFTRDYYAYGMMVYSIFEKTRALEDSLKFSESTPPHVRELVLALTHENLEKRSAYWKGMRYGCKLFEGVDWERVEGRGSKQQTNLLTKKTTATYKQRVFRLRHSLKIKTDVHEEGEKTPMKKQILVTPKF